MGLIFEAAVKFNALENSCYTVSTVTQTIVLSCSYAHSVLQMKIFLMRATKELDGFGYIKFDALIYYIASYFRGNFL